MTKIGSAIIIDKLQPRTAGYLSIVNRNGAITVPGHSFMLVEVMPTGIIERAADIAFKHARVRPSVFQLDGRVGYLGVQSPDVSAIRDASAAVLEGLDAEAPTEPAKVVSSELILRLDHHHAQMTNKLKSGSLCIPGEALYVLECQPAPRVLQAANDAEKAADIKIVDFRFTGSMGRLIISGKDEAIRVARDAALESVRS